MGLPIFESKLYRQISKIYLEFAKKIKKTYIYEFKIKFMWAIKIISKLSFLHAISSFIVSSIPYVILHNFSKYHELRKALKIIDMDKIDGCYCEFGCFTGAALKHVIKLTSQSKFLSKKKTYGFDSFKGFPEEVHSEFKSENFISNYDDVKKLEKKTNGRCKIVKGYFDESLKSLELNNEIKNISLAFIDCDLAVSSQPVFEFIKKKLVHGSFIVIDEYYFIDKNGGSIRKEFLKKFEMNKNVFLFSTYGLGGAVFKYYTD